MKSPWQSAFESDAAWCARVDTPAFVLDEAIVMDSACRIRAIAERCGATLLYSVKACSLPWVLQLVAPHVHGYSVSSLFEARLAQYLAPSHHVHFISPAVRFGEMLALLAICERITINSFGQLERINETEQRSRQFGIRVNPGTHFVTDPRYDPCRRDSKLGVPLDIVFEWLIRPEAMGSISGLHFHSNCDSDNVGDLVLSIRHIEARLCGNLSRFRWLNIGGGYTYEDPNVGELCAELVRIGREYNLEVVMEPGAAFVRRSGCFVSSVIDICVGDECPIAILDLSVNHWPEVFEYQFEPDVVEHNEDGKYTYRLAGCSCLAGDLFGVYSFNKPLEMGSRIVFANAGAYSIVKAHMFNGINLPNIYSLTCDRTLILRKSFTYEDFASRWGVNYHAVV